MKTAKVAPIELVLMIILITVIVLVIGSVFDIFPILGSQDYPLCYEIPSGVEFVDAIGEDRFYELFLLDAEARQIYIVRIDDLGRCELP